MLQRALAALLIAGLSLLPGVTGAARATTLTVDVTADTFDGSCADGDCSLRDAIASALDGDTVELPSGFYPLTAVEAGVGRSDGSIEITVRLTIHGVGETGAFIDASGLGSTPFLIEGAPVTLIDLTVFGARTTERAGVAQVDDAALRLTHVTITGGRGGRAGAVDVGSGGTLVIRDSLLVENRSSGGAGAVRLRSDGVRVRAVDSTFLGNRGVRGGAIAGVGLDLRNVTFARNVATDQGGAVHGNGSWSQVTITRNRAPRGAAVATVGQAEPHASHLVISGNTSGQGGQCLGRLASYAYNVESHRGCGFRGPTDRQGIDPDLGPVTANGGPTPTASLPPGSVALDVGGTCSHRDQRGAPRDGPCDAGAYERVLCRGRAVDIVGTPGDDDLSGGRERDTFLGLGGDDEFQGSLDRDRACGGAGDDHLIGGPDEDVLVGGAGNDVLDGEGGGDRCLGGPGRDRRVDCEG